MSETTSILTKLVQLTTWEERQAYLTRQGLTIDRDTLWEWKGEVDALARVEVEKALRWSGVVFQVAAWTGKEQLLALAHWIKGNALFHCGRPQEALDSYDRAEATYAARGDTLAMARMGLGKLAALNDLGRNEDAVDFGERVVAPALAASTDPERDRWLADLAGNLGVLYDELGRYEEAVEHHNRNLAWWSGQETEDATVERAMTQDSLGVALTKLGLYAEAQTAFESARPVFVEHEYWTDIARVDINLAWLAKTRGADPGEVESAFDRARKSVKAIPRDREGVEDQDVGPAEAIDLFLLDLDEIEWRMDRTGECTPETIQALQRIEAESRGAGLMAEAVHAGLLLARGLLLQGRPDRAEAEFRARLEQAQAQASPEMTYRAYHGLGLALEQQNDTAGAVAAYEAALAVVEGIQSRLQIDEFRAGFLEDKLGAYQDLALLLVREGDAEAALATVERAKARSLVDLFLGKLHGVPLAGDEADEETKRLVDDLHALRQELARQEQALKEQDEGSDSAVVGRQRRPGNARVQELERQITGRVRQIAQRAPRFASLQQVAALSIEDICRQVQPQTLLLSYGILRGEVWVFALDEGGVVLGPRCLGPAPAQRDLEKQLDKVRKPPAYEPGEGDLDLDQAVSAAQDALAGWHQLLIAPLGDLPGQYKHLLIVPDGLLHHLPFHAFYDGGSRSYLVEHHQVSYAPSIAIWALTNKNRPPVHDRALALALCGDGELAYTLSEIGGLTESFSNLAIYVNDMATRDRLPRNVLQDADLFHFATHGRFRPDAPLLSSITLADGTLTAFDAYSLQLNASLVALTACETGRGRLTGNEMLGLVRGLFYAGARALVVSQWVVDDWATAVLVTAFYESLRAGMTVSEALQAAQGTMLRSAVDGPPEWRHPYYWAPFVMLGADSTVGVQGTGRRVLHQAARAAQALTEDLGSLDAEQLQAVRDRVPAYQARWTRAQSEVERFQVAELILGLSSALSPDAGRELALAALPPAEMRSRAWARLMAPAKLGRAYRRTRGINRQLISIHEGRPAETPSLRNLPTRNLNLSEDFDERIAELFQTVENIQELQGEPTKPRSDS